MSNIIGYKCPNCGAYGGKNIKPVRINKKKVCKICYTTFEPNKNTTFSYIFCKICKKNHPDFFKKCSNLKN